MFLKKVAAKLFSNIEAGPSDTSEDTSTLKFCDYSGESWDGTIFLECLVGNNSTLFPAISLTVDILSQRVLNSNFESVWGLKNIWQRYGETNKQSGQGPTTPIPNGHQNSLKAVKCVGKVLESVLKDTFLQRMTQKRKY